ncbi:toprim domain-containing protein [Alicyclobacillus herbarius]|uniref:toprim domain-containing protein n=1 Tax=Alicyclobacillus herbarius TaxID=122960 RepID=UPI002356F21E|nr:DUF4093 domain-containing protein [Alicyclobacillus herbarius]
MAEVGRDEALYRAARLDEAEHNTTQRNNGRPGESRRGQAVHGRPARQRPRFAEVIVVEGMHDKQKLESVVDADVFVVGGDRVGRRVLDQLRRIRERRGLIILTDPDGPGERIRRRIDAHVPGCRHAFIPRREATDGRRVGVELASREAIVRALEGARATRMTSAGGREAEPAVGEEPGLNLRNQAAVGTELAPRRFTLAELTACGLAGSPGAAVYRQRVGEVLGIGAGNAKSFVKKLNLFGVTLAEWDAALAAVQLPTAKLAVEKGDEAGV